MPFEIVLDSRNLKGRRRHPKNVESHRGNAWVKYYNEGQMRGVRETLEADVLKWPGVVSKEMMGCLCYFRGKKFFAFLITNGIVITKLAKEDRSKLSERPDSKPFEMAGRTASTWIQVAVRNPEDLQPILPYVRKSYQAASHGKAGSDAGKRRLEGVH